MCSTRSCGGNASRATMNVYAYAYVLFSPGATSDAHAYTYILFLPGATSGAHAKLLHSIATSLPTPSHELRYPLSLPFFSGTSDSLCSTFRHSSTIMVPSLIKLSVVFSFIFQGGVHALASPETASSTTSAAAEQHTGVRLGWATLYVFLYS